MEAAQVDGRRARGDASRRAILDIAMDQASVYGLAGISIGGVAEAVGMSKGGVTTLFGSKEQLQLATVAAAKEVLFNAVVTKAMAKQGLSRLEHLIDGWIEYSRNRTFSGGCFFAATEAEWAAIPGEVHDAVAAANIEWSLLLKSSIAEAVEAKELPAVDDPDQAAFEINALLDGANLMSLLHSSDVPYKRARAAISRLLGIEAPRAPRRARKKS